MTAVVNMPVPHVSHWVGVLYSSLELRRLHLERWTIHQKPSYVDGGGLHADR